MSQVVRLFNAARVEYAVLVLSGDYPMAKQSQLDKAIAKLEGERAVLDLAIQKLRDQQQAQTKPRNRKPKLAEVPKAG